jgi:hypothetical protein
MLHVLGADGAVVEPERIVRIQLAQPLQARETFRQRLEAVHLARWAAITRGPRRNVADVRPDVDEHGAFRQGESLGRFALFVRRP